MRFMMVVSPAAAIGRACSGAPCLIIYQSGPIRMEARLRESRRERKGEAEADAQQKSFTCAHTSESIPQRAWPGKVPRGAQALLQYQGPTAGARPVYDGRFNLSARRPISEENLER